MPDWVWFLVALTVGGALLGLAAAMDLRARRRVSGAGQPAPRRNVKAVDRLVPSYLTQEEIDSFPSPADGTPLLSRLGEGFGFGHVHPDFATSPAGASWDGARILIVNGPVDAMRELLSPLAAATTDSPLVVVAEGFADEVVATLAANRRALRLPIVAAAAPSRDRLRLAELIGARQLDPSDLMAGYVPEAALGRPARWASTIERCWVAPEDEPQGL